MFSCLFASMYNRIIACYMFKSRYTLCVVSFFLCFYPSFCVLLLLLIPAARIQRVVTMIAVLESTTIITASLLINILAAYAHTQSLLPNQPQDQLRSLLPNQLQDQLRSLHQCPLPVLHLSVNPPLTIPSLLKISLSTALMARYQLLALVMSAPGSIRASLNETNPPCDPPPDPQGGLSYVIEPITQVDLCYLLCYPLTTYVSDPRSPR